MGKESVLSLMGLPTEFGIAILLITVALALAPYFAGYDFGVIKVPDFSNGARSNLKIFGPIAFGLAILLHLPIINTDEKRNDTSKSPQKISNKSGLLIESNGAQATAEVGNSRISTYNRADILLSVRQSGAGMGINSLAPPGHIGHYNNVISLPAGWKLHTKLVPAGGCDLKPTHIYNEGTGDYTLSVMTTSTHGPCPWLKGEYHYKISIRRENYEASTIGKIVIN